MRKSAAPLISVVLVCVACALARADERTAVSLRIDTILAGPIIDRNIFGQFAEHLGFTQPQEVAPQALSGQSANGELIITLPAKSVAVMQVN